MVADVEHATPFLWWGPTLETRPARSLRWLVGQGMLTEPTACLLAVVAALGRSLLVVAEPSGAGKTTLLTAALAHLPPGLAPIFLRGAYESFAALDDPALGPGRSVLLVNEISPSLPVYLWGPSLERALAAARRGFVLHATSHAADAEDFIDRLARPPLLLPRPVADAFDLVVAIDAKDGRRRVSGLWAIVGRRTGEIATIGVGDGSSSFGHIAAAMRGLPDEELGSVWASVTEASLAAAAARLDAVFEVGAGPIRPGAMLARADRERSRRDAGLP